MVVCDHFKIKLGIDKEKNQSIYMRSPDIVIIILNALLQTYEIETPL